MAEAIDKVSDLTLRAAQSHLKDLGDEIARIGQKDTLTEADETYLEELTTRFDEVDEHRKALERKALVERVSAVTNRPLTATPGHTAKDLDDDPFGEPESVRDTKFSNPWNLDEVRRMGSPSEIAGEYRARALSAIEKMSGTNDARRKVMTDIIERSDSSDGRLAKQLLASSSPDYMRAFVKMSMNRGHTMTPAEQRAMSLTDTAGGYLVPFQLDPSVIITSDGSFNQIRSAARQVIATGDVWNGVSSAAVSWSWDTEATQVSDDATTFAQPTVEIHKAAGFVPISLEALADAQNVASEIGRLLAFGKDDIESVAFATGSGSDQPFGIVTALQGVAGSVVSATTNDAFVAADVYKLDEALPARYRARASFLANRAIYNDIRQFDTSGGGALWERIGNGMPNQLLGRPAYEAEGMDGAIATGDDYVLVFGDFDNYVIADRIGTTVEFIPHLFGDNHRPTGQRGWYAYFRVGADSVNDGAFRLLKV
jgi:HK97 family phage major capsid protein